jgi:UDP-glucose 4-epimerase
MVKKVLITGSSGYIGSHLTHLLKNEYEVHGLDVVLPKIDPHTFYHCDINRTFTLEEEFDCVIHLAAKVNVGESEQHPIMYYITNLNGTMNILNKVKTKNFIFASTGAAEKCVSAYGISKRAAEDVVREYCTQHNNIDYTIFRFYNVVGSTVVPPTNQDGLMYNLIKAINTGSFTIFGNDYNTVDGTCERDYVHVLEICGALKTAIDKPSSNIECLGHGIGRTVYQMSCIFQDTNQVEFEVLYGPRRKGDIESSVLQNVSPYMKNLYSVEQLLKVS